jgi:chorismate mutase
MVAEVAAQWEWLRSSTCATDLDAARAAVVDERNLDPLYQRALAYATRSYCQ